MNMLVKRKKLGLRALVFFLTTVYASIMLYALVYESSIGESIVLDYDFIYILGRAFEAPASRDISRGDFCADAPRSQWQF